MTLIPSPSQKKILSAARKLLSSAEWSGVQQGLDLIDAQDPEVWKFLLWGTDVDSLGMPTCGAEIQKSVKAPFRKEVAIYAIAHSHHAPTVEFLSHNFTDADSAPLLRRLTGLTRLRTNVRTPAQYAALAELPHLVELRLWGANTPVNLDALAPLTKLERLAIEQDPTLRDLAPLARLSGLRSLTLSRVPNVTDLTPLAGLPLEELEMDADQVPDLGSLTQLPALRHLKLRGSPRSLLALKGCSGLASLALGTLRITDPGLLRGGPPVARPLKPVQQVWSAMRESLTASGAPVEHVDGIAAKLEARDWQLSAPEESFLMSRARGAPDVAEVLAVFKTMAAWVTTCQKWSHLLNPGASDDELAALQAAVPYDLPCAYIEMLRLANGSVAQARVDTTGFRFLSARESLHTHNVLMDRRRGLYENPLHLLWDHVPLCGADGDGWFMNVEPGSFYGGVYRYNHEDGRQHMPRVFASLAEFAARLTLVAR